ncbi:MAG: signal peptidase I [Micromonosporaceae bacterium]
MRSKDESDRREVADRTSERTREGSGGKNGGHRGARDRGRAQERSFWRELPVLVILALGLALLIKTFLIQAFYIPSESMENTLVPGDRVLVNKLAYRLGEIQRGDVIVFNGADSWESEIVIAEPSGPVEGFLRKMGELFGFATVGEKDFIKRVIGLPGDRVACAGPGKPLTVNGKALHEAGYLHRGDAPSEASFDIRVPPNRVWVMGDHRAASADSRSHLGDPGNGTIPTDHVLGRAFVVVWPVGRVTGLTRPPAYAEAGLAATVPGAAIPLVAAAGVVFPLAGLRRVVRRRRQGTS